jgi:arylsulfatase A-like enzyme
MSAVWRRAAVLLAAFWAAKVVLVTLRIADGGGRGLASAWTPLALAYQDVIVVLLVFALDAVLSHVTRNGARKKWVDRVLWVVVGVLVVYSAFNVAVARVFSTPLTASMIGATGGALSDSILAYVTWSNLLAILAVCALAVAMLWFGPRETSRRVRLSAGFGAILFIALGPLAASRVETLGLHRNATVSVVSTWLARVPIPVSSAEVAPLPVEGKNIELSHLTGAARRRNVVWVILESTAERYLGAYGASPDPMPRLTELAKNALVFEAAYCAHPESIKGLFSMLCSTYPAPNTTAADYVVAHVPCPSIATLLKALGYRTAFFHSGRFRYLGMQGILDDRGFDELHDAESVGGEYRSSFGTDDASTVRRMLAFVDQVPKGQPFFAVYSPISGHHPYKSPGKAKRPFPEQSERDRYQNDLFVSDSALGELLDGLKQRGVYDETVVIVVGDHGEAFQQHEGNFAHTLYLYEENVHVPMIVSAPGITVGSVRVPQIASLVDLAPTTLALVGSDLSPRHQGRSLLGRNPGFAPFYTDHGPLQLGLRQGRWKLIHETEHDRTRLFDLETDPMEQRDVAGDNAERAQRYRQWLLEWSDAQRSLLQRYER